MLLCTELEHVLRTCWSTLAIQGHVIHEGSTEPLRSEQVKKRCRWLLSFSSEHLSGLPGSSADPFQGTPVDANIMGAQSG